MDEAQKFAEALRRLRTATTPIERLAELKSLEGLVRQATLEAVLEARAADSTWAAIGGCLGMTRQSAQAKFTTPPEPRPPQDPAQPTKPPAATRKDLASTSELLEIRSVRGRRLLRLKLDRTPLTGEQPAT